MNSPSNVEVVSPETINMIYKRRAIRKYKETPVAQDILDRILDAGRMAPSAMNKQPWKFNILNNKETIKAFSKEIGKSAAKHFIKSGPKQLLKTMKSLLHFSHKLDLLKEPDPIFHSAPVVIFITAPRDNEWAALDIGMCAQNMMLAAKSLGLDSCPVGLGKYVEQTKVFSRLNIPSTDQVYLAIIFGYGDESPEIHPRMMDNVFYVEPHENLLI